MSLIETTEVLFYEDFALKRPLFFIPETIFCKIIRKLSQHFDFDNTDNKILFPITMSNENIAENKEFFNQILQNFDKYMKSLINAYLRLFTMVTEAADGNDREFFLNKFSHIQRLASEFTNNIPEDKLICEKFRNCLISTSDSKRFTKKISKYNKIIELKNDLLREARFNTVRNICKLHNISQYSYYKITRESNNQIYDKCVNHR